MVDPNNYPEEYNFRLLRFTTAWSIIKPLPEWQAPLNMVDSGVSISTDWLHSITAQMNLYRNMIEPRWSVTPKANITAYWERIGNHYSFAVKLINQSGGTISRDLNNAEITALVYEEVTPDTSPTNPGPQTIFHTNRYVRGLVHQPLTTAIPNEGAYSLSLTTSELIDRTKFQNRPINWNKLHGLVFVDYRPVGAQKYEMLQAAPVTTGYLMWTDQTSLIFLQDLSKPNASTRTLKVGGFPSTLSWKVDTAALPTWLKVSPTSGGLTTQITVGVDLTKLTGGQYNSQIKLIAEQDSMVTQSVPVTLILSDTLHYYWAPVIGKAKP